MKISVFILLSISIVFYACKPAAKVPDNKMKVIMWSIMKDSYDSASNTFKFNGKFTDEDLAPLEEVFKKNNVSRQDFYYTFENLQQDPANLKILMDSVIAYGTRELNKIPVTSPLKFKPKSILE